MNPALCQNLSHVTKKIRNDSSANVCYDSWLFAIATATDVITRNWNLLTRCDYNVATHSGHMARICKRITAISQMTQSLPLPFTFIYFSFIEAEIYIYSYCNHRRLYINEQLDNSIRNNKGGSETVQKRLVTWAEWCLTGFGGSRRRSRQQTSATSSQVYTLQTQLPHEVTVYQAVCVLCLCRNWKQLHWSSDTKAHSCRMLCTSCCFCMMGPVGRKTIKNVSEAGNHPTQSDFNF